MRQALAKRRVAVLSSDGILNELIASYLRLRLSGLVVEHGASVADLGGGLDRISAFIVVCSGTLGARSLPSTIGRVRREHPDASILVAAQAPGLHLAVEARLCGAHAFIPHLTPLSVLADALKACLEERAWVSQGEGCYTGPCRRRARSKSWSGPERRRPAPR